MDAQQQQQEYNSTTRQQQRPGEAAAGHRPVAVPERRRQQRLHLSCGECRRRKIRCDRAKPCMPCVRAGRVHRCEYDNPPAPTGRMVPGQLVFAARPAVPMHRRRSEDRQQDDAGHSKRNRSLSQTPAKTYREDSQPPTDAIPPLRQFWHGSKAGDPYVSPFDRRTISVPKEVVFGENDATVYWGRSHEANFVPRITDMTTLLLKSVEANDVSTLIEVEHHTRPKDGTPSGMDPVLLSLVPPRPTADRLLRTYIGHFESYYRVLHVPTFEKEYQSFWVTQHAPLCFLAQLLSICAISSCFRDEDRLYQEEQVRAWIEAVRQWLFKLDPRAQLTLGALQAHLLMLVAGDVHWMKIDRSWISAGSLIRNAISAGLHREPRDFFRISPFHAELRRRLWYSILEYDLLTCFAKGRSPQVREDEYDCELPANTQDELFSEGSSEDAIRRPPPHAAYDGYKTPTTTASAKVDINITLAKYLPLRSRVCHAINSIKLDIDYDEVLRLDAELQGFLRETSPPSAISSGGIDFKHTLHAILGQRAVIALHAPFVTRAIKDPKWIYSRTRCLETAHAILSAALALLDDTTGGDCGPFATVTNICRCEISNSVFLACHELLAQVVEQRGLAAEHSTPVPGFPPTTRTPARWETRDKETLVGLVERTAAALNRVSKPDVVSQRTCAWVRLSADLCRAAAPNDDATIPAVKEAISRGIQGWRTNLQTQGVMNVPLMEQGLMPPRPMANFVAPVSFGSALDEDYFNLFFDMNVLGGLDYGP